MLLDQSLEMTDQGHFKKFHGYNFYNSVQIRVISTQIKKTVKANPVEGLNFE
jgi:hypothetical protein